MRDWGKAGRGDLSTPFAAKLSPFCSSLLGTIYYKQVQKQITEVAELMCCKAAPHLVQHANTIFAVNNHNNSRILECVRVA